MLNKSRAEQVLAKLQGHERISLPALARSMGITYEKLQSYLYGRAHFPVELAPDLYEAVAEVDPVLAVWAWETLCGAAQIKRDSHPTAAGVDRDPVPADALQAQAALGELSGQIATFGETIDPWEAPRALPAARALHAVASELVVKLERIASETPQRSIRVVPEVR